MCPVGDHGDAADGLLARVGWRPGAAERIDGGEQRVVIAHDAAQIHGDDGFRARRDEAFELGIVHLIAAGRHIAQHRRGAYVADGRAAGGIGVGARDNLVAGPDAQRAQGALKRRGGRTQARYAFGAQKIGQLALKLLRFRTGGNPAAAQRIDNLGDFRLGDIGR